MWSIRKGSWKQQTEKNNDLKGKWNYFFHISIVFSAGFCCQCSMLTVHLWWILQDVSALFLYRACCTNISCFILWLTRKQSIFSILEFPCYRKALAMLLTLTAGLLSKEKNNHKRHNLKSWWLGKHLSAGEQTATQHQHSPLSDSLSVHSWFTLLLLFHLTWRELPGGNNASSCVGCVLADVLPPSVWVILCFYGNQSIFGWFSFSRASPQCNQC